jgi:hypothetical protein
MRRRINYDRLLSMREGKASEQIEWHIAKGEQHSEKSLRYYRSGFEMGWIAAIKALREEVGDETR